MNLSIHMRMVNDYSCNTFKIYFAGYDLQKRKCYMLRPVKNKFEWVEHAELAPIPDDAYINIELPQVADFKKNLINEIEQHNFVREPNDKELKATKYHLEDIRSLLFKAHQNQHK